MHGRVALIDDKLPSNDVRTDQEYGKIVQASNPSVPNHGLAFRHLVRLFQLRLLLVTRCPRSEARARFACSNAAKGCTLLAFPKPSAPCVHVGSTERAGLFPDRKPKRHTSGMPRDSVCECVSELAGWLRARRASQSTATEARCASKQACVRTRNSPPSRNRWNQHADIENGTLIFARYFKSFDAVNAVARSC